MQKIINVIAVSSGVVSLAVVGSGLYVYLQRDQLVDNVKSQVMETILDSLGGLGGGIAPDITIPDGANDLSPSAPQTDTTSATGLGVPGL
tara:strand:+ start:86 stop:355 length:270 start_codon:yes stop_codon:yes gene_type:complete